MKWEELENITSQKVKLQERMVIHFNKLKRRKFLRIPLGKKRNNYAAALPSKDGDYLRYAQNTFQTTQFKTNH